MNAARIAALAAACLAAGCEQLGRDRKVPDPVAQVDTVELRTPLQPLVDLDGRAGYDGLICEVRFYRFDQPRSVPVTGTLELVLYDGRVPRADLARARAFCTTSFTRRELLGMEGTDRYGLLSYRIPLPWGPTAPGGPVVTLVARYVPPQGRPVYSEPTSVPLNPS